MPTFRMPGHVAVEKSSSIADGTSARTNSPVPGAFGRAINRSLYHEYDHETVLCRADQMSIDAVFSLLLSSARYIAPTDDTAPVTDGMIVNVYLALLGVRFSERNPIRVTVSPSNYSVVNTTMPGHMLHPGQVTRQLKNVDGNIVIHTKGIGSGIAQGSLNYIFCSPILDRLLPRADTPSGIANNLAAADVWGGVDELLKARIQSIIHVEGGGGSFDGAGASGRW